MALAQSYALVLAAETLGRVRAVLRPDTRPCTLSDDADDSFRVFFPATGTRTGRTRHELVIRNSVSEMFCFNNTIRLFFNTNFLAIISPSSQTYLGL